VLGESNILEQLRDTVEVDERGLATLLRALELIRESVPDFQRHGARMAFDPTVNDEIGAVIFNFLASESLSMSNALSDESCRYSLTIKCECVRFLSRKQLHSNGAINIWNNTEGARRVL
jgi:hypothetical protein